MSDRAVIDASVVVDAYVANDRRERARAALRDVHGWAPALIDAEIPSALARLERAGELSSADVDAAVRDWAGAPVERVAMTPLMRPAWSMRHSIRIADAYYVALARALDCPLLTTDARLARAPLTGVSVTVIR